jgi:hypothetical protein
LAIRPLRPTTRIFIFQRNTNIYSPYVTSSLTRGWVCPLQLLLGLASAVILRSQSAGLMTTCYCLRFDTPPIWSPGPRIYIPQEHGGPVIPPGIGFPFRRLLRPAGLRCRYSTPPPASLGSSLYSFGADTKENTASNSFAIIIMGGCLAIARILVTCLQAATEQFHVPSSDCFIATVLHAT